MKSINENFKKFDRDNEQLKGDGEFIDETLDNEVNGSYNDAEYEEGEYEDEYDDDSSDEEDEYDEYEEVEYEDEFYDDKLNHILDEIAELKLSIGDNTCKGAQTPSSVVVPVSHSNNEAVMYNEISRLRDEINKTQANQTLQQEMRQLKDEIEKSYNESKISFLSEIDRLNRKIEFMQRNQMGERKVAHTAVFAPLAHDDCSKKSINIAAIDEISANTTKIKDIVTETSETISKPVIEKLDEIIKNLSEIEISETNYITNAPVAASFPEDVMQILNDIKDKTEIQNEFLSKIDDLKQAIDEMPEAVSTSPQTEELAMDIYNQLIMIKEEFIPVFVSEEEKKLKQLQADLLATDDDQTKQDMLKEIIEIRENIRLQQDSILLKIEEDLADIREKLATAEDYDTVTEILSLKDDLKASRILNNSDITAEIESFKSELTEIKTAVVNFKDYLAVCANKTVTVSATSDGPTSGEVNLLLSEIVSLRDEVQSYKDDVTNILAANRSEAATVTDPVSHESITGIFENYCEKMVEDIDEEITDLKNALQIFSDEESSESKSVILPEIAALKEGINELKSIISRRTTISENENAEVNASNELNVVLEEIVDLKTDITGMKADILGIKEQLSDVISVKDDIAELKQLLTGFMTANDNMTVQPANIDIDSINEGIKETLKNHPISSFIDTLDKMKYDIKTIKDEPDLSALNEVLALREEFQSLKDEFAKSNAQFGEGGKLANLNKEIQSLRDQIFSIAMANVSEDDASESSYESYNNLILDELASMRDDFAAKDTNEKIKNLFDAVQEIKEKVSGIN